MKQKIRKSSKIIFILYFLLCELFAFGVAHVQAAGTPCQVNINFNPTFSNQVVNLAGVISWTNPAQNSCTDSGNTPVTYFSVLYYINGSSSPIGDMNGPQYTYVAAQSGQMPFSSSFDPFQKGYSNQTIRIKACVTIRGLEGLTPLRCSADTPVVIPVSSSSPSIVVSPPKANNTYAPGDQIRILGYNFTPGQTVDVSVEEGDPTEVTADRNGSFSVPLTISTDNNFSLEGSNTVVATPQDGSGPYQIVIRVSPASSPANSPSTSTSPTTADYCAQHPEDTNKCLYNPLPTNSLTDTLLLIMKAFLGVIAAWAVAFIVIGGFRFVMSQGNEEAVTAAKKTITYAIIGLVVAMLAFSIIAIIQNLLQAQVRNVPANTSRIEIYL